MKTNANWTDDSAGLVHLGSATPEIADQRQVCTAPHQHRARSATPEIADQRQVKNIALKQNACSANPESGPRREKVIRRYTFKLYPNRAQISAMQRQAVLLASLWNAALEQREIQWSQECQRKPRSERKGLSKYDQARDLKHIRAEDPEYAAMGSDTMNLCLVALDDAFKAFFKRAKGGAGKSSGYPRYKSPHAIEHKGADCTVWHREHRKGWRLDQSGRNFRIYAKGIPGTIKARGKFPVDMDDLELRDMRLIRVGGIWQCSIVVKMDARRGPGAMNLEVALDLIDQFATVRSVANGGCHSGWAAEIPSANEQVYPQYHRVNHTVADDSLETGSNGGRHHGEGVAERADDSLETDHTQSEGDRRFKKFSYRWRQAKRRVAKRKAKEARQRKEALHLATTRLVRHAAELTVIAPPIRENSKSARGNESAWGAAVKTVAALNRHVLSQAPAMTIQMLEYKAEEAGIPFARVTPGEHALAIGRALPEATKTVRRLRREIRKKET